MSGGQRTTGGAAPFPIDGRDVARIADAAEGILVVLRQLAAKKMQTARRRSSGAKTPVTASGPVDELAQRKALKGLRRAGVQLGVVRSDS